ncbi:MAG: fibronectin type III domain-containing protein, partial [Clostridia bacterium]|nr:fibronectin type III domain-containing protein [Clostridia bacterium]
MKKIISILLSFVMICSAFCFSAFAAPVKAEAAGEQYVCLGYLADWMFDSQSDLRAIDFNKLTHVNFAFSLINSSTYLPEIGSPSKLVMITNEIARQGADTKVMISIGGWGAGYFCEACNSASRRTAFANRCASWFDQYNIAGIDLDWEYPGDGVAGISYCSNDKTDFTALMQAIRNAIGSNRLLTMAGGASASRASQLECSKLAGILDFVNLMNYDYNSTNHASFSQTKSSAQAWVNAGFSKKQINIGLPFYARSTSSTWDWMDYVDLVPRILNGQITVTTVTDESYGMANGQKISFDTPEQIRKKDLWVKEQGYGGVMCWELMQDYNGDLLSTMYDYINGSGTYNSPYIPIPGIENNTVALVTNLQATNVTQTSARLTWTASADADYYQIYSGSTLVGTTSSTSYNLSGLTASTSYTYKVRACTN